MIFHHFLLAIVWIIYCVLHSVLASEGLKNRLKARMKNYKWYRLWYSLFAFVFLVVLLYFQVNMATVTLFASRGIVFILGLVLCISGLVLMFACIYKYFMNLSGLRSLIIENFSSELEITGVHRYVRHPLYLGTFSFIWGLLLLFPYASLLIADTIITVYTLIAIEFEEKKLVAEFGESYTRYRATVPKLIPSFRLPKD
ncbi:MAG: methyltransferase family protein [Flavisolibacter sp.]